jgi:hypothetical protein
MNDTEPVKTGSSIYLIYLDGKVAVFEDTVKVRATAEQVPIV